LREANIGHWHLSSPGLDCSPECIERFDDPILRLSRHPDIAKTCRAEHPRELPGIRQCKGEVKCVPLIGEASAERPTERAPHWRFVWCRVDTYRCTPTAAEDAAEFGEPPRRVWKEHQAELADDGIETGGEERQRLTIRGDGQKRIRQPGASRVKHCRRNIGPDD